MSNHPGWERKGSVERADHESAIEAEDWVFDRDWGRARGLMLWASACGVLLAAKPSDL